MRFKVRKSQTVRDLNPDLDTIPEFEGVKDEVLKFVFWYHDYDSPYWRVPRDKRKALVLNAVGITNENTQRSWQSKNSAEIDKVTNAFIDLIKYSEEHDLLMAIKQQFQIWIDDLKRKKQKVSAAERKNMMSLVKDLPDYIKRVRDLEATLGYREEDYELAGNSPLSALEKYNRREQKLEEDES